MESNPAPIPRSLAPFAWNHLSGRVISILHGFTRTTIKVVTQDDVAIRMRCASEQFESMGIDIGQQVVARINASAVLLGTAAMWSGNERWNRWAGRIVLVEPGDFAPLMTVKLQGKSCTLKSTGPVAGQPLRPQAWEAVNIVIDPEEVTLMPQRRATRDTWTAASGYMPERNRVWLKARVEAVRRDDGRCVVSLDVGGAHVSAVVYGEHDIPCEWAPGSPVEMHVGQWEA